MWGTLASLAKTGGSLRFIPACVGNADSGQTNCAFSSVHPRVCGERFDKFVVRLTRSGSSPRVWGTRVNIIAGTLAGRFIPACVGNAVPTDNVSISSAVHPRVCGERIISRRRPRNASGSSPRVWGTHGRSAGRDQKFRFIPACVGNARKLGSSGIRAPVHPRVCGERADFGSNAAGFLGSSPRVWGTLERLTRQSEPVRFIPACVGNALPPVGAEVGMRFIPACVGNALVVRRVMDY